MTTAFDESDAVTFGRLAAARRALADDLKRDPATLARGLDSDYRMRPHLRVIAEAMADVLAGLYDRLLVISPPQVGKSTLVGEWGPFWWLANRPSDDIVIASYGASLAWIRSKAVRDHVIEHGGEYGLVLRPDSAAKDDWHLTSGGHLRAAGVGGSLTGFSANCLIVDDPHAGRAEAESPVQRNAVHAWWSSVAVKRLQPDVGVVIAILTRFHPDDWAGRRLKEEGRVEEGGRWKVVHLPAVADPKFGKDPLGREPGEPLTHPKIPTRDRVRLAGWWADMKATSIVRDWHSLAQGDPQPTEGALVSEELLRLIRDTTTAVEPQKISVAVDPSGGGRDTAGIVGGFLGDDGRLWITHDRSDVMASADWSREVCRLAHEIDAAVVFVETNYGGDMCLLVVRTAWEKLQKDGEIPVEALPPQVKPVRARQGKLLRAEPIAQQMILDRVRLRGIFVDLEREWCIAGGSRVATVRGEVSVEDVVAGDLVLTRAGWRPVLWSGCTGTRPTVEVTTEDGKVLRCTSSHEIRVDGRGWVPALELELGDRIPTCPGSLLTPMSTSGAGGTSATHATATTSPATPAEAGPSTRGCIAPSGPPLMGPSPRAGTSCSSTATRTTSPCPTCGHSHDSANRSRRGETQSGKLSSSRATGTPGAATATTSAPTALLDALGSTYYTGPCGQPPTGLSPQASTSTTRTRTAETTPWRTLRRWVASITSATTRGRSPRDTLPGTVRDDHSSGERTGLAEGLGRLCATAAALSSTRQASAPSSALQHAESGTTTTVIAVRPTGLVEPVFDITVAEEHEFFANGLLVHNCTWQPTDPLSPGRIDASVYLAYGLLPIPSPGSTSLVGVQEMAQTNLLPWGR